MSLGNKGIRGIILFLLCCQLTCFNHAYAEEYVVTEYQSEESEDYLWDCISEYSPSDYITAGVIGYFERESCLRSDAVAGWCNAQSCFGLDLCGSFTEEVDSGLEDGSTKDVFMEKSRDVHGGYGLGQWSSYHLTESLYEFAQDWGTSISDAEMQCAFVIESLQADEELWERLLTVKNAYHAGVLIAIWYEGTSHYEYVGTLAEVFYSKHVEE